MKKLMVLLAVVSLTASTGGCQCLRGLFRGEPAQPCAPVAAPCCPNPCDPCAASGAAGAAEYAPGPIGP
jgi:hypothetical protein